VPEPLILTLVLAAMLAGFVLERFPVDVTAILALAALLVFDLVTPAEAVAGFSNPAVITVLMLFILSEALTQSGAIAGLGHRIVRLARGVQDRVSALLMVVTGVLSAFVTNTATVSIMMPVSLSIARRFKIAPSRLLIPLSYAAIFGGTCTLIGTSTNILVGSLADDYGVAPFSMFEFVRVGGLLFVTGIAYNLLIAPRLLRDRPTLESLTDKYQMANYLTELRVGARSDLIDQNLLDERIGERFDVSILEVQRDGQRLTQDLKRLRLQEHDLLIVRGRMDQIVAMKEQHGLLLLTDVKLTDEDLEDDSNVLVEVQLLPQSDLLYANLKEIDFRRRFGCFVLALNRVGHPLTHARLGAISLQPWDTLLVFGPRARVEALAGSRDFNLVQEFSMRLRLAKRWWIAASVIVSVVLLAALGVMELVEAAIVGVATLLATRTLRIRQAYRSVDWSVIFLLAALIPMGTALERTGLAEDVAETLVGLGEGLGPWAVLSLVILATSILTEAITNVSAAVLMVPIAVSIAVGLGVDPKPFLMAIAFGASMSFATPTGYQTNTMVYGPGGYRYTDYVRVGVPLNLFFWLVASVMIPVVWPY
jgi:di/tricarboxylate transporter